MGGDIALFELSGLADGQGMKVLALLRPSQGFCGFREKGYLFSGLWGEGSFIFRDLGRKHNFCEQRSSRIGGGGGGGSLLQK